jgi:uncharacterized protein (TIGR02246 family)
MIRVFIVRVFAVLALIPLAPPAVSADVETAAFRSNDEAAVRRLAARWEQAWNGHDMKALANLFTDDADFVNVGARHWKGRTQIEEQHASRLPQFIESTWSTRAVTVRFLKPDLALVHVDWSLKGDKDPDGTLRPPRNGVFTWVAVKADAQWLIRAAQNTNQGTLAPH